MYHSTLWYAGTLRVQGPCHGRGSRMPGGRRETWPIGLLAFKMTTYQQNGYDTVWKVHSRSGQATLDRNIIHAEPRLGRGGGDPLIRSCPVSD